MLGLVQAELERGWGGVLLSVVSKESRVMRTYSTTGCWDGDCDEDIWMEKLLDLALER